jgi:hypothetical protein
MHKYICKSSGEVASDTAPSSLGPWDAPTTAWCGFGLGEFQGKFSSSTTDDQEPDEHYSEPGAVWMVETSERTSKDTGGAEGVPELPPVPPVPPPCPQNRRYTNLRRAVLYLWVRTVRRSEKHMSSSYLHYQQQKWGHTSVCLRASYAMCLCGDSFGSLGKIKIELHQIKEVTPDCHLFHQ